ncbi:MAG: benzoate transporter, partial [Zoogloeaceae bacterium]|nr:benzoate transporter [Zoogloeaceae bacterium]
MKPFAILSRFFIRLITALLITVFVGFFQYACWEWANRGELLGEYTHEFSGLAYSAYQRNQSPFVHIYPSEAELEGDVDLLARHTRRLRIYSSLDNVGVVPIAGFRGLKITGGIWLDRDAPKNDREIAAGIALAKRYKHIERMIVGNESILRGDMTPEKLIPILDTVKKATKKPVSTAEPWHVWLRYPELVKHVDFITVHLLPYHEGLPVENALSYAKERYREIQEKFPKKKIVIGEIGWPSRGPDIGAAEATQANEASFIRNFLLDPDTAHLDYFIMEAVDQPWKVDLEGWAGAYWGIFNADRVQKFSLEGMVTHDLRWKTKAYAASLYAAAPIFLIAFFLAGWSFFGRLWLCALVQGCVT